MAPVASSALHCKVKRSAAIISGKRETTDKNERKLKSGSELHGRPPHPLSVVAGTRGGAWAAAGENLLAGSVRDPR